VESVLDQNSISESSIFANRGDLHIARKIWHILMGLFILGVIFLKNLSPVESGLILGFFLALSVVVESFRLRSSRWNKRLLKFFSKIIREDEAEQISGIPYYLAGVMVSVVLFPAPVSYVSILFLVFGDPAASVFGISFGSLGPRLKNGKSLVGTLSAVFVCSWVAWAFCLPLYGASTKLVVLSVLSGIIGGTAELIPVDLDDNFIIPVVSGAGVWLLFGLLGFPTV